MGRPAYHFLRPHSSGVGPFLQNIAENSNFAKRARSETVFRPKPLGDNAQNLARKLRTPCPEVPSKACPLSRRNRHRAIQALRAKLTAKNLIHLSFRKGCLSTLGAMNVPSHRLADHADHSDVASSRIYTVDTVLDRARNSDLIGSCFLGGKIV